MSRTNRDMIRRLTYSGPARRDAPTDAPTGDGGGGGSNQGQAGDPPTTPEPEPKTDKALGEPGEKALKAEREARKAAEKKLAAYERAEQERAEADKTEAEKRAAAEQRAADAELRAMRIEVAADKGLTPAQAKRLVGATREELEADADQLLTDFPTTPAPPAGPRPDPSQGARGATPAARPTSLTQAVTAAMHKS